MRKVAAIAASTTILAFSGSNLSYAAPVRQEVVTEIQKDSGQEAFRRPVAPELVTQAIAELKTAAIPHETVYGVGGVKTTFRFGRGFSFTVVEPPAISSAHAFIGGGWRWGKGPYITLSPRDQDVIIRGSEVLLVGAICRIPAVGWATCGMAGVIINEAANYLKGRKVCGSRELEVAAQGIFSMRVRCI